MTISDTHAHYTDERFDLEYPGGAPALLEQLFLNDVGLIINMSVNTFDIPHVIGLAARFPNMFAATGIHPTELKRELPLVNAIDLLKHYLDNGSEDKIVCIGEIGLDYHYEDTDRQTQKNFFRTQMELAGEYNLPVSVHDRDAHEEVLTVISDYPNVKGVLHCYSGSLETAEKLVSMGWYIGVGGVVTFKNARKIKDVVSSIPIERILLETDCPYLSPEPFRGKLNRSDYIRYTIRAISEIRGMVPEEVADICMCNALNLFKISK